MKAGHSRTLPARSTLSRVLKDTPILTALPVAHRLSPATLALAALAGGSPCSLILSLLQFLRMQGAVHDETATSGRKEHTLHASHRDEWQIMQADLFFYLPAIALSLAVRLKGPWTLSMPLRHPRS